MSAPPAICLLQCLPRHLALGWCHGHPLEALAIALLVHSWDHSNTQCRAFLLLQGMEVQWSWRMEMKKNKEEMLCSYHFREYVICCIHGSYLLVCFVAMIVLTIRTKLQTMPESLLLILKTYRRKIKKNWLLRSPTTEGVITLGWIRHVRNSMKSTSWLLIVWRLSSLTFHQGTFLILVSLDMS